MSDLEKGYKDEVLFRLETLLKTNEISKEKLIGLLANYIEEV